MAFKPCPNCWLRPRANLKRQRRTQHKTMMRMLSRDYSQTQQVLLWRHL